MSTHHHHCDRCGQDIPCSGLVDRFGCYVWNVSSTGRDYCGDCK